MNTPASSPLPTVESKFRVIPRTEFISELEAQGVPQHHFAFKCPWCGNIQSFYSLSFYMAQEGAASRAYFSCEGRYNNGSRGCDWTLGGLLKLHTLEVIAEDGKNVPSFEPASPAEAKSLMEEMRQWRNE